MRSFIYYLQRATCGALAYLVLHQFTLGLRMLQVQGKIVTFSEWILRWIGFPGIWIANTFFDPVRPLHIPPALAHFFINILFYFAIVWLACFFYNFLFQRNFVGQKKDPFILKPWEEKS